jgi:acyl-CoA synthetase (AMP-forming)/AMP-acid ligase II
VANLALALTSRLVGPRPVLVCDGRATSAEALLERTRGLAAWLTARGLGPGDRALVLVPPGPDLVAAVLATLWVGAVPVLADPGHPDDVFQAQVRAARPRWALVDPRLALCWRLGFTRRVLAMAGRRLPPAPGVGRLLTLPGKAPGDAAPVSRHDGDEALVVFTAGTTSEPRGVVHTHGSLAAFLDHVASAAWDPPFSSYVAETPPQAFYGLAMDAVCYVARGQGRMRQTGRLLAKGGVEAWFGGPWFWARWLAEGRRVPAGLRALVLGSSPVTGAFLRRLLRVAPPGLRVSCLYGLTEAGPVSVAAGAEKAEWTGDGDLAGRAVPGMAVRIDAGEVRVAGAALAPRYLDGSPIAPWLSTGDLGRLEGDRLVLLGRQKDMILRRGRNIYPGLLEPLLLESLDEAALVGVHDGETEDERVVLAYVGARHARVRDLLGEAAPDHVLRLDALPRAGRQQKIDRPTLRRLARERFRIPE